MMFLMYALTAAYISGAGELIASSINDGFGASLSPETGAIVFTLIGGGVVCAGTSLVDLFNRFLFSAKILFLVVMLVLLAPHVHKINLLSLPLEKGLALSAIPVIFTSFGFHGSVPSIVSYMNGDIRKLRRVFVIGSAIPLIAYLFWQLVTLGSIDSNTFIGLMAEHSGLNGFWLPCVTWWPLHTWSWRYICLQTWRWQPPSSAWRLVCLTIWRICSSVAIPLRDAYRRGR